MPSSKSPTAVSLLLLCFLVSAGHSTSVKKSGELLPEVSVNLKQEQKLDHQPNISRSVPPLVKPSSGSGGERSDSEKLKSQVFDGLQGSMHILRDGGSGQSLRPKASAEVETGASGVGVTVGVKSLVAKPTEQRIMKVAVSKLKKIVKEAKEVNGVKVHVGGALAGRKYTSEDESSTLLVLRLAQCRASCLSKKLERVRTGGTPEKHINTFYDECWDTCLLLEIENGRNYPEHHHPSLPARFSDPGICSENNSCFAGCQDACRFHDHVRRDDEERSNGKPPLLAATKVESFLSYNLTAETMNGTRKGETKDIYHLDLSWPSKRGEFEAPLPVVYSVVQHVRLKSIHPSWTWRLLEQTTLTKVSLTFTKKPKMGDIRVLAANSEKLVHVFSEEKREEWEKKLRNKGSKTSAEAEERKVEVGGATSDLWHLKKVSMVHQKFLVVTEVTWDAPIEKNGAKDNYLLTWEVAGGIIKGNMVTDTNTVTISLWPDTLYSIQVGLIEEDSKSSSGGVGNPWEMEPEPKVSLKSRLLVVNTSEAVLSDKQSDNENNDEELDEDGSYNHHHHEGYQQDESVKEEHSSFESKVWRRCGGSGDDASSPGVATWLCQLSISALVIFGSIYGLLVLFSMMLYVLFAFRKSYPYGLKPLIKSSTSKLSLLEDFRDCHNSSKNSGKSAMDKSAYRFSASSQSLKILAEGVAESSLPYQQHMQDFHGDDPDVGRRRDYVSVYNIV